MLLPLELELPLLSVLAGALLLRPPSGVAVVVAVVAVAAPPASGRGGWLV
jgi:hypothetical protein